MTNAELAARLSALDWSGTSLQHQLAISAAVTTLDPSRKRSEPMDVYSNVVALVPASAKKTMRHVTLLRLDGTLFATAGFLPGPVSAPWSWIVETVAHELSVSEDSVGCQEADEDDGGGDFVTVDGLRVYRISLCRNKPGASEPSQSQVTPV